jgi:hypothetical protein
MVAVSAGKESVGFRRRLTFEEAANLKPPQLNNKTYTASEKTSSPWYTHMQLMLRDGHKTEDFWRRMREQSWLHDTIASAELSAPAAGSACHTPQY